MQTALVKCHESSLHRMRLVMCDYPTMHFHVIQRHPAAQEKSLDFKVGLYSMRDEGGKKPRWKPI